MTNREHQEARFLRQVVAIAMTGTRPARYAFESGFHRGHLLQKASPAMREAHALGKAVSAYLDAVESQQ